MLDNINSQDKLYLTNSFVTSVTELEQALKKKHYDLIISFGQAFLDLDTIQIETLAQIEDNVLKTNYEYLKLKKDLEKEYYRLQFMVDTGNSNIKKEMQIRKNKSAYIPPHP